MNLEARTSFGASNRLHPSWRGGRFQGEARRDHSDRTLGLDDDEGLADIPTAHLELSQDAATADVAPPLPTEARPSPPRSTTTVTSVAAPAPRKAAVAAEAPEARKPEIAAPIHEPAPAAVPVAPRELTTGSVLANRYVLGRLLGAGGSSLIFQAADRRLAGSDGQHIALKVLRPEMRHNPHALTRLKREFRQMQKLTHAGIARVFALECDEDIWFMTMELIDGHTINQWLKANTSRSAALQIISGCCEALAHAHEAGIVHGDLKPSNVLVLGTGAVKLVDFGSAAEHDPTSGPSSERSFAATPPFASPQVLAGEFAEPRDDVFSLACLSYAVLTRGEHPFDRKSSTEAQQAQLRPAFAPGMQPREFEVIVRGLAWEREQRPASVREFLHGLLASDLRREPTTREQVAAEMPSKPVAPDGSSASTRTPEPRNHASEKPRSEPARPNATAASTTSSVRQSDIDRLKAAVSAAEAHVERQQTTTPPKAKDSSDPMTRFRGYVAGPLAARPDESPGDVARAAPEPEPERTSAAASTPKPKRLWPWQRAFMIALALVGATALVVTQRDFHPDPIQQVQARPLPSTPPVAQHAEPTPAPAVTAPVDQVAEKKSPATVAKRKPATPTAAGEVSFTTRTLEVGAGQTIAALSLKRSNSTRGRARIAWTIDGGTAKRGVDYQLGDSRVVEFLDGQTVRSLFIPLTPDKDPARSRHSKTFTVKLQPASGGAALGEIKQVYVTIVGDVADERFATTSADAPERP